MRAVPLRIQHSSACAGTALWAKTATASRIDPAGDQRGGHFAHVRAQLVRVDMIGERVEIGEEEEAFRLVLHPHPAQDRAEKIAEMEPAGRLDAGNDTLHVLLAHASRVRRLRSSFRSSSTNAPVKKQAIA